MQINLASFAPSDAPPDRANQTAGNQPSAWTFAATSCPLWSRWWQKTTPGEQQQDTLHSFIDSPLGFVWLMLVFPTVLCTCSATSPTEMWPSRSTGTPSTASCHSGMQRGFPERTQTSSYGLQFKAISFKDCKGIQQKLIYVQLYLPSSHVNCHTKMYFLKQLNYFPKFMNSKLKLANCCDFLPDHLFNSAEGFSFLNIQRSHFKIFYVINLK